MKTIFLSILLIFTTANLGLAQSPVSAPASQAKTGFRIELDSKLITGIKAFTAKTYKSYSDTNPFTSEDTPNNPQYPDIPQSLETYIGQKTLRLSVGGRALHMSYTDENTIEMLLSPDPSVPFDRPVLFKLHTPEFEQLLQSFAKYQEWRTLAIKEHLPSGSKEIGEVAGEKLTFNVPDVLDIGEARFYAKDADSLYEVLQVYVRFLNGEVTDMIAKDLKKIELVDRFRDQRDRQAQKEQMDNQKRINAVLK